jgi:hypothetical protein
MVRCQSFDIASEDPMGFLEAMQLDPMGILDVDLSIVNCN